MLKFTNYAKEPSSQFVSRCKAKQKRLCQRTIITICVGVQGEAKTTMPKNHHHNLSWGARRSENDYVKEPSSQFVSWCKAKRKRLCQRTIITICLEVQGEAKKTMPKNHHHNLCRGARRSEKDYAKEPSSQFVSGCKAKRKRLCQRTIITMCLAAKRKRLCQRTIIRISVSPWCVVCRCNA